MRVLSGIQPSGRLHLGNYFGAIRQFIELQRQGAECFYFLANLHSLTTMRDAEKLRELSLHLAAGYLALGVDPTKSVFFLQSDVPQVNELGWFLNTVCPVSLMQKAHAYKDKLAKGFSPNMALFDYPVLMAADILIYDSDLVPVGQDQKQHVEMARDLAMKFNLAWNGEVLKLPDAHIVESVAIVPGLDGQKMSKSYNNTIEIFQTEKQTKKNVGQIVTDSTPLEEPKNPEKCNVFALLRLFLDEDELAEVAASYRAGGYGYGHAKARLTDCINARFADARKKYDELIASPDTVRDILREGGRKARDIAEKTMQRVRAASGIITTY
ncbi:MAG TPA: tryptophan--tRNA ligase [Phycisphaerae bacterium]|nr:tryptophan--tRNA ligase [Phycisphaerae bacterium]HPS52738.1 tryptophan--tRNA ligase [Phycisphaerae bacterium]